jgi:putative oxidoreductase
MKAFKELISLISRLIMAALFIYASYDKVWQPAEFAQAMANYELIPIWLVNTSSALLAWLELTTGLFLLLGVAIRAAALWTSGLLFFFIGIMIYAGLSGAGYDCGCFPGGGHDAGFETALRDMGFMIPSLWLVFVPGRWLAIAPGRGSKPPRDEGLLL